MYCSKCGNELKDDALFCPYCGTKVEESLDDTKLTSDQPAEIRPIPVYNNPSTDYSRTPTAGGNGTNPALVVIAILLACILVGGIGYYFYDRNVQAEKAAAAEMARIKAEQDSIQARNLQLQKQAEEAKAAAEKAEAEKKAAEAAKKAAKKAEEKAARKSALEARKASQAVPRDGSYYVIRGNHVLLRPQPYVDKTGNVAYRVNSGTKVRYIGYYGWSYDGYEWYQIEYKGRYLYVCTAYAYPYY